MIELKVWYIAALLVAALLLWWWYASKKPLASLYGKFIERLNAKLGVDMSEYLNGVFTDNGKEVPPANLPTLKELDGVTSDEINRSGVFGFKLSIALIAIKLWIKLGSDEADKFKVYLAYAMDSWREPRIWNNGVLVGSELDGHLRHILKSVAHP